MIIYATVLLTISVLVSLVSIKQVCRFEEISLKYFYKAPIRKYELNKGGFYGFYS